MADYPRINSFKSAAEFRAHLHNDLKLELDLDDSILSKETSPLAQECRCYGRTVGNRWCILPMEGWDCLPDGSPSELTRRRWMNFAESGAKLLFGCEACAVTPSGKSNTRQMMMTRENLGNFKQLYQDMVKAHAARFGTADDLLIGLQLTHSGRYSHPNDDAKLESVTAYSHPLLDEKFHSSKDNVVSDAEVERIIGCFVESARLAHEAGFHFVDVKMAHGYLGHEFLSAFDRPGKFGGDFENRTRFFREIVERIRTEVPQIAVATRISLFDCLPFEPGPGHVGIPMERNGIGVGNYKYAFGGDGTGLGYDLTETVKLIEMAQKLGVELICTTACSPYYNPHFQRPAYYPVSDGYLPPEEPVIGAARQLKAVQEVKKHFEGSSMRFITSGCTCLQEYFVQTMQYQIRAGHADFAGYGRLVLSYPDIPAVTLAGEDLDPRRICRTFGDCTTAPRHGLVSGCYPLDRFYKAHPSCGKLQECKAELRKRFAKLKG